MKDENLIAVNLAWNLRFCFQQTPRGAIPGPHGALRANVTASPTCLTVGSTGVLYKLLLQVLPQLPLCSPSN